MAKKTKKKEFKEVEVINNSKYTLRTKLTDDGEKFIIDVIENKWDKWRNRLAYLTIIILLITMFSSCASTSSCSNSNYYKSYNLCPAYH